MLFAALALAALVAGAASRRTRAAQAGMLIALSTLPCAGVLAFGRERFVYHEFLIQSPGLRSPIPAAVYFSPGGVCTEAIVKEIAAALRDAPGAA